MVNKNISQQLAELIQKIEKSEQCEFDIIIRYRRKPQKLVSATEEEHLNYYQKYHKEQVRLFLNDEALRPSQAWSVEEPILRKLMNKAGKKLDREHFQDARDGTLRYIENEFGVITRMSDSKREELKDFLRFRHT